MAVGVFVIGRLGAETEPKKADHVGACIGKVVHGVRHDGNTAEQCANQELARKEQHVAQDGDNAGKVAVSGSHLMVAGILRIFDKQFNKEFCQMYPSLLRAEIADFDCKSGGPSYGSATGYGF